jgi:uncharacterized membrane protein YedE/YeeE
MLVGVGHGLVMVCSTQLTTELIGSRTNHAAFVLGCFAFTDKLVTGAILFALQFTNDDSATHVRIAATVPSMLATLLAAALVIFAVDIPEWNRKHTLPKHLVPQLATPTTIVEQQSRASSAEVELELQAA